MMDFCGRERLVRTCCGENESGMVEHVVEKETGGCVVNEEDLLWSFCVSWTLCVEAFMGFFEMERVLFLWCGYEWAI